MKSPQVACGPDELSQTGIEGLDHILHGGLPAHRLYLLRGLPGSGKTTLALQYLLTGAAAGEQGLYISLSETKEEVEAVARSHGWSLDKIAIFELSALEEQLKQEAQNTVFHASEIELNQTTEALLKKIEEVNPRRIAIDSLSELRLLAESALRYRRQLLSLKQYFSGKRTTVLLLDDHAGVDSDLHVESIAHGVVALEQQPTSYGAKHRRIEIVKLRGVDFIGGYHDATIARGGLEVFPRLIAAEHQRDFDAKPLGSGNAALDTLLGGGVDRGTSCLLLGPSGTGKSTLALQFAVEAAIRGEKVVHFLFEESIHTLIRRAESLGMPIRRLIDNATITLRAFDPAALLPGQFVHLTQRYVQKEGVSVVVIDSLNGYQKAMPGANFLMIQLHELQSFLARQGVVTFLTLAQQGVLDHMQTPLDVTYLADTVLLLRFFEHSGEIRKAVSVMKKRAGWHESTIREFSFDQKGIKVGDPLHEFHGVLTGVPVYSGKARDMLRHT